mgnify:CR=1 FL=1
MHIEAIFAPKVFINTNGELTEHHIKDFNCSPRINVQVTKTVDGRFDIVGNNVDMDCVGGVCPVR